MQMAPRARQQRLLAGTWAVAHWCFSCCAHDATPCYQPQCSSVAFRHPGCAVHAADMARPARTPGCRPRHRGSADQRQLQQRQRLRGGLAVWWLCGDGSDAAATSSCVHNRQHQWPTHALHPPSAPLCSCHAPPSMHGHPTPTHSRTGEAACLIWAVCWDVEGQARVVAAAPAAVPCLSTLLQDLRTSVSRTSVQRSPPPARPPACSCDDIWLPHFEFINVRGFSQVSNPLLGSQQLARLLSLVSARPLAMVSCCVHHGLGGGQPPSPPPFQPPAPLYLLSHLPVPPKQDRVVRYGVRLPSDNSNDAVGWWVHIQVRGGGCTFR